MEIILREYNIVDNASIIALFFDTVHTINAKDYSEAELNVWAPEDIDVKQWCQRFLKDYTVIAEINEIMVGFANIDVLGHLDCLYVHKDYQGKGIAGKLLHSLEAYAIEKCVDAIEVGASITAKSFFEKNNYEVIKKNEIERGNQILINFTMSKQL